MNKNKIIGALMLFVCSVIWGITFVAQSEGAEHIPPMWFICIRNVFGIIVLSPVVFFNNAKKKKLQNAKPLEKNERRFFVLGSALCGFSLCAASYLQQLGITMGTPSGKAAFITALYIVIVPIASIVFGRKVKLNVWLGAIISVFGLYLLCINSKIEFMTSDLIVLVCAFVFTVQIIAVDIVSPRFDGVQLAAMEFLFCAVFAFLYAIVSEKITFSNIKAGIIPLLYAGIFASGVAYTLQITGQKRLNNPTLASMLMSLESVIGAISGAIMLNQRLSKREIAGCVLMFAAIILAQLPIFEFIQKRRAGNGRA